MIGLADLFKKRLNVSMPRERILRSQLALVNKRLSQANADREYYIDAAHRLAKANQGLGGEIRELVDENKELKGQLAAIHNLEMIQ